jgi:glutathione S-transferase
MVIHPGRFVDVADGSLDSHVRAAGIKTARDCFKYIDAKLEGKKWAVGDDFSAVDAYLLVFYRWGVTPAGIAMEQDYPNYARLVAAVKERESVKEAFKAEGIN